LRPFDQAAHDRAADQLGEIPPNTRNKRHSLITPDVATISRAANGGIGFILLASGGYFLPRTVDIFPIM
jgi:hypothetical protein